MEALSGTYDELRILSLTADLIDGYLLSRNPALPFLHQSLIMSLPAERPVQTLLQTTLPQLSHKPLVKLLQKAYSAEKAAAYAYVGHAASVKNPAEKIAIKQIEEDEWGHRAEVLCIMQHYNIPVSKMYEVRFAVIGRIISASCYVIGWFMPFFFAGKLESGNVCEYFRMKEYFNSLNIHQWNQILYEMGMKEKEHEVYFLSKLKGNKLLPLFERLFGWGSLHSANNIDLDKKYRVEDSGSYCKC